MAKKTTPPPPIKPPDAPLPETVALPALAARYLDFWQRNLLAWSNDISPPPPENGKNG